MAEPFLGELRIFGCNFAPVGWALCAGQLLSIATYTALFSIIGTFYGGDGRSTFALPNLRGMVPIGSGQGPGLSVHDLGETAGSPTVTLLQTELPMHTHSFSSDPAAKRETSTVANNTPAGAPSGESFYSTAASNVNMAQGALSAIGSNQPHDNMQPYLTMNFCIALVGIFPARG